MFETGPSSPGVNQVYVKSKQNRLIDDLVEVLSGPLQHSACEICKSDFSRLPVEFFHLRRTKLDD
jgi:hypothetical protein